MTTSILTSSPAPVTASHAPSKRVCWRLVLSGVLLLAANAYDAHAQSPARRRPVYAPPKPLNVVDSVTTRMDSAELRIERENAKRRAAADSIGGRAVVDKDRVVFTLLLPKVRTPLTDRVSGHYVWRIDVMLGEPLSFVVRSDSAMSGDNVKRIVQASQFRRCDDPLDISSLRCVGAMNGSAQLKDGELRIETRDPAVVAHLRKFRPALGLHHVFEPEGRFYSDQFHIQYR